MTAQAAAADVRWSSYPTLVTRARWAVSAGSVGVSVEPMCGGARLFYALDVKVRSHYSGRFHWRPVKAGAAFDRSASYRLRRGVDTPALVEFVAGAQRLAEARRERR